MIGLQESRLVFFEKLLNRKNYSNCTIKTYINSIEQFCKYVNKLPSQLSQKDVIHFFNTYKFTSISLQNQFISSIKLFYKNCLDIKLTGINLERPRKEKHLPQVIDKEFLLDKISKIENLKHKAIISLGFSVGLRVSEVINLKIEDIDSKRMIINIKQAKGKKDRVVPLSQTMLELLRKYFIKYNPKVYLFNGQFSNQYTSGSCNQIVKKYLGEQYHFHLLRHSCFTSLIENGTDIRIIQKIAGHSNIKTTEIYTHVSTNLLNKIELPI